MQLSARVEYGCLAMLELARSHHRGETVQVRRISEDHNIPSAFLLQIMQQLRRSGLVTSQRGVTGGFRLTRKPEAFTLAEIVSVFEESATPQDNAPQVSPPRSVIQSAYRSAEQAKQDFLERFQLDQLCSDAFPEPGSGWGI